MWWRSHNASIIEYFSNFLSVSIVSADLTTQWPNREKWSCRTSVWKMREGSLSANMKWYRWSSRKTFSQEDYCLASIIPSCHSLLSRIISCCHCLGTSVQSFSSAHLSNSTATHLHPQPIILLLTLKKKRRFSLYLQYVHAAVMRITPPPHHRPVLTGSPASSFHRPQQPPRVWTPWEDYSCCCCS